MIKTGSYMRVRDGLLLILLVSVIAIPAQAFTLNSFSVDVQENGDCIADFDYTMSFLELIGYYTNIASAPGIIKDELDKATSGQVDLISANEKTASFKVYDYAKISESNGATTYTIPSLNLTKAEEVIKNHWVSQLTSFDLSPDEVSIVFPDGYIKTYYNEGNIPQTVHTV